VTAAGRGVAQFSMDNAHFVGLPFRPMAQPEPKLTSPASLLVDAVLVVAFFIYIYTVLAPHVPSADKKMIMLWGALSAACMTGVFWLALQMFRVVYRGQREANRK
jgi:hypothetical protein